MSTIGSGYDLDATSFSPDGRVFQVEYAQKAVDNSGTIIAITSRDGVVTAVDRPISSKLILPTANPRVLHVNDYIGFTAGGVYPDALALLDYCQEEAIAYLKDYRDSIPIKKMSQVVSEYMHIYTLGSSRPFGTAVFFTAYSTADGPSIYLAEPSGLAHQYTAWAIGKNGQAAKAELEKLDFPGLSMEQAVKEAVKILITVRDESKQKNHRIEMGWVGIHTNEKHETIPESVVKAAEDYTAAIMEEEDAAED